jgi:hypothetical protein
VSFTIYPSWSSVDEVAIRARFDFLSQSSCNSLIWVRWCCAAWMVDSVGKTLRWRFVKVEGHLEFACYPRPIQLLVTVKLWLSDLSPLVLCAVPAIKRGRVVCVGEIRGQRLFFGLSWGPTKLKVLRSLLAIRVRFNFLLPLSCNFPIWDRRCCALFLPFSLNSGQCWWD